MRDRPRRLPAVEWLAGLATGRFDQLVETSAWNRDAAGVPGMLGEEHGAQARAICGSCYAHWHGVHASRCPAGCLLEFCGAQCGLGGFCWAPAPAATTGLGRAVVTPPSAGRPPRGHVARGVGLRAGSGEGVPMPHSAGYQMTGPGILRHLEIGMYGSVPAACRSRWQTRGTPIRACECTHRQWQSPSRTTCEG